MSETHIRIALAEILHEISGVKPEDVTDGKAFLTDLDIDSLTMVEVLTAAEDRFGVRIPDEQIERLVTVGDAVAFIAGTEVAA